MKGNLGPVLYCWVWDEETSIYLSEVNQLQSEVEADFWLDFLFLPLWITLFHPSHSPGALHMSRGSEHWQWQIFSFRASLGLDSPGLWVPIHPSPTSICFRTKKEHWGARPPWDAFEVQAEHILLWGLSALKRQVHSPQRYFPERIGGKLRDQQPVRKTHHRTFLLGRPCTAGWWETPQVPSAEYTSKIWGKSKEAACSGIS